MKRLSVLGVVLCGAVLPASVEAQFFTENFDSYVAGSTIAGQGGWETWDNNPAANTTVSNAQSSSAPNSLFDAGPADIVHQFTGVAGGIWYIKARTYVPSTQTGELWFILLNTYAPGGPYNWSIQVALCAAACSTGGVIPGQVLNFGGTDGGGGGTATLITDQWVEVRAEVDFGANTYAVFYNGVQFDTGTFTSTGQMQIQAMDLFSNLSNESYMDDIWVDTTLPVELMNFSVS
jgi:hypothetical protein